MQNVKLKKISFEKYIFNIIDSYYFLKHEKCFGIAVSGGPDSMLLLNIINKWIKKENKILKVFTFNHNLRASSINEVLLVKKTCIQLNCDFFKIDWKLPPHSAIMEKARIARYSEISSFCKKFGIKTLFLGHHADDIAETVAIRLLKNSSIDGLCPIFKVRELFGIKFFRPFLEIKKKKILDLIQLNKIDSIEDPSNKNEKYLRAKVRKILEKDKDLKKKLIQSSRLFCRLRDLTNKFIKLNFLKYILYKKEGYLIINRNIFQFYPQYMLLTFLKYSLTRIGNKNYPPETKLLNLICIRQKKEVSFSMTLSGCFIKFNKQEVYIIREFININSEDNYINKNELIKWDNRFLIKNNTNLKFKIVPLGQVIDSYVYKENYLNNKKYMKKIPHKARIALPVIKTLEGLLHIPHLNIYKFKNIEIDTIDFYNKKYDNIY